MTTRRDLLKALPAGTALAATLSAPLEAATFTWSRYESFAITMMLAAGLDWDNAEEASSAILRHMFRGDPIPAEHEWARRRCRAAIRALQDRLDAA